LKQTQGHKYKEGFFSVFFRAKYRKTQLLVPGVGPFSNANIYLLDQLIEETKTDLKLYQVFY
jgi:hypothetical protein